MLTNERLDRMERYARDDDLEIQSQLLAIAQAREANELLAENERLRRDHKALEALQEMKLHSQYFRLDCMATDARSWSVFCFDKQGNDIAVIDYFGTPADALLAWAEKYGTQEAE